MLRYLSGIQKTLKKVTTIGAGGGDTFNFANIQQVKGLYAYVVGAFVRITGSITQTSGTDTLTVKVMRKLLKSLTVTHAEGEWCSSISGVDLCQFLLANGIMTDANLGGWMEDAALTGTSANTVDQSFLVTFAPYWYLAGGQGRDESDLIGAIPVEALKDGGQVSFTVAADGDLTGNFGVTSGTTYTVEVFPEVVYTNKPITWVRTQFHAQAAAANENTFNAPGSGVRQILSLIVGDDAWSSFTQPDTNNLIMSIDDRVVQRLVDGSVINKFRDARATEDYDAQMEDALILMSMLSAPGPAGLPLCRDLSVDHAHLDHGAARYLTFTAQEPSPEQLEGDLQPYTQAGAETGRRIDPAVAAQVVRDYRTRAKAEGRAYRLRSNVVPANLFGQRSLGVPLVIEAE